MADMADGNLDRDVPDSDLANEVGDIGRALVAIKDSVASHARAESESQMAVQRQVVTALGEGLANLKAGRLNQPLTRSFPPDYEVLRQNFNDTAATMARVMHKITQSVDSVRTGASEISAATADLARRTEHQAASLENSSAAVRELTDSVTQSSRTASDATGLARTAHEAATSSGELKAGALIAGTMLPGLGPRRSLARRSTLGQSNRSPSALACAPVSARAAPPPPMAPAPLTPASTMRGSISRAKSADLALSAV